MGMKRLKGMVLVQQLVVVVVIDGDVIEQQQQLMIQLRQRRHNPNLLEYCQKHQLQNYVQVI
jgi:hypothetical protein